MLYKLQPGIYMPEQEWLIHYKYVYKDTITYCIRHGNYSELSGYVDKLHINNFKNLKNVSVKFINSILVCNIGQFIDYFTQILSLFNCWKDRGIPKNIVQNLIIVIKSWNIAGLNRKLEYYIV